MVGQKHKQLIAKLKLAWRLVPYLMNAVQPLHEDRRAVVLLPRAEVAASLAKHVTKRKKVFLNQYLKPIEGPVVRIEHQSGQSAHLRGSVPSVRAVH